MHFVRNAIAYTRWTLHYFEIHQSRRQHEKLIGYIARFQVQSTSRTPSSIRRPHIAASRSTSTRLSDDSLKPSCDRTGNGIEVYADAIMQRATLMCFQLARDRNVARWISTYNPWSRKTKHSERSRNRAELCRLRSFQKCSKVRYLHSITLAFNLLDGI